MLSPSLRPFLSCLRAAITLCLVMLLVGFTTAQVRHHTVIAQTERGLINVMMVEDHRHPPDLHETLQQYSGRKPQHQRLDRATRLMPPAVLALIGREHPIACPRAPPDLPRAPPVAAC